MKKRVGIISGLILALILGLLVWQSIGPREPVYQGRKLSSWLYHHVASSAAIPRYNSPGWREADQALHTIGSNAVPTLLKMMRAKDPPPPVLKLLDAAGRHPWTHIHYVRASARNEEAEYAFRVLGTNGVNAVPELVRIYEENISPSSQSYTARSLQNIGPGAREALPVLIRRFHDPDTHVRFCAVSAVMSIGGDADVVIPALTDALKDSSVDVRWNALSGLSRFGSRARSVAPEIQKMLGDPGMVGDTSITQEVATTLWRIAPELTAKSLVVEAATPMITNGVTAEAVKVLYDGKHRPLIPAGRKAPAVSQYWKSDPRPGLKLYRGTVGTEDKDHFLGRFEVLVLTNAPDLNISTLCVVADGQIILCARDNTREQFLEIRRVADEATK